jgi:hypothetical protein
MAARTAPPFVVTHARTVGLLLLLPVPLGVIGSLTARRLVVPGDAAATAGNILASESLFRLGIVSTLLLMIVDVIVALLVFYRLFEPVNRHLAVLMVVLNLMGVPITMLNELNKFAVLYVLDSPDQVSFFLNLYDDGSLIAGLFWGIWLVPYAVLVARSGFLPRYFAVLLVVEFLGFWIHSFGGFLLSDPPANLAQLPAVTTLVELFLPLWLIVKGIDVTRWDAHVYQWEPAPST